MNRRPNDSDGGELLFIIGVVILGTIAVSNWLVGNLAAVVGRGARCTPRSPTPLTSRSTPATPGLLGRRRTRPTCPVRSPTGPAPWSCSPSSSSSQASWSPRCPAPATTPSTGGNGSGCEHRPVSPAPAISAAFSPPDRNRAGSSSPAGAAAGGSPPRPPISGPTRRPWGGGRVRPSQSGKTTGLIAGLGAWKGPAIVSSVKTDLYRATRDARTAGGEIKVFDPLGVTGADSATWSPLAAHQRTGRRARCRPDAHPGRPRRRTA